MLPPATHAPQVGLGYGNGTAAAPPGKSVVRIGQRSICARSLPARKNVWPGAQTNAERLEVRGLVPVVSADEAVKDAKSRTNRGLPAARRVPGNTDAGLHVMPANRDDSARDARIADEELTGGRSRLHRGLHTRYECGRQFIRIRRRSLDLPADAQVEGQARIEAEVILCKQREIVAVGVGRDGSVLFLGAL